MRRDLEILQELFLPLLGDEATRDEAFWEDLNSKLLTNGGQPGGYLAGSDAAYKAQWERLWAEYVCYMAQDHCAGRSNATIDHLLHNTDARFAAEVSFQRDMLAALTQVSHAELKAELDLADTFEGQDVADAEISAAYKKLERNIALDDLRSKLQRWDEEDEQPKQEKPAKRKRRLAIPLMLLRFAAAAAVFTGGVVGVMQVYNHSGHDAAPTASVNTGVNQSYETSPAGTMDSTAKEINTNPTVPVPPQQHGHNTITSGSDTARVSRADSIGQGAPAVTTSAPARLPRVAMRGTITETETGDTVYNVLVTLADDKGNKQTHFSKDGFFSFDLALHRNYMIVGSREHYRSVPRALSTKNIKDTDADTVMTISLQLAGDR